MVSNTVLEEYWRTWEALQRLYERKKRTCASDKELELILTESGEVMETIKHLTKGESRYKW